MADKFKYIGPSLSDAYLVTPPTDLGHMKFLLGSPLGHLGSFRRRLRPWDFGQDRENGAKGLNGT